jgi:hypothetical protein
LLSRNPEHTLWLQASALCAWELPHELTSKGKPFVIGKFYNLTGDARGNLRQDLESWFGRALDLAELEELDLILEVIGRTGTIGLMPQSNQSGAEPGK